MWTRRTFVGLGMALPFAGLQATQIPAQAKALPNIVILATGGTIASSASSSTQLTGYRVTEGVAALLASVPEAGKIARLTGEQVINVASPAITTGHLIALANRINVLLASADVDGVVVTHGTDTLEETAYFLNVTVKSRKPVVIVAAMRPASALSADGPLNLYNAILLASTPAAHGRGVMVALNDRISAARFVVKTHTTATDAFRSQEQGFLGAIVAGRVTFDTAVLRKHTVETVFDVSRTRALPRVDILYEHQDSGGELYDALVRLGTKGIVVAGVGRGGFSPAARTAAIAAAKAGVVVVRSTRIAGGTVPPGATDATYGFVAADSLTPQKARILLMLALAKTTDRAELQEIFSTH